MMSMTECNAWCPGHHKDWGTKCAWSSGECSACAECSDTSSRVNCQNWCPNHSGSWGYKCAWKSDVCSGCAECEDVEITGCENWCTGNGNELP